MQFLAALVGLVGLAAAQSDSSSSISASIVSESSSSSSLSATSGSAISSSVPSDTASSLPSTASPTSAPSATTTSGSSWTALSTSASSATSKPTAVTVALDGSAQFTAINLAIAAAQNSAIPSVVVQAGVYSESILIQGTQTVTISGPTASSYAQNQVVIAAAAPSGVVSFNTQKSNGIVLRNVNLTNTISTASAKAPAFYAYGSNMLLDTVALVSGGIGVYQAGFGTTMITNSYIEGKKLYIFKYSDKSNPCQVPTSFSIPT